MIGKQVYISYDFLFGGYLGWSLAINEVGNMTPKGLRQFQVFTK